MKLFNFSFNISAFFFGLTVHFKIYPIIFAMVFYTKLAEKKYFINLQSIKFGIIAAFSFLFFTFLFYKIYGFECLFESLLYHLIRKDHRYWSNERHNFSIQFMYIYLNFFQISKAISILFFLPSVILIFLITRQFSSELIFASFLCTYIFVAFNKSKLIFSNKTL